MQALLYEQFQQLPSIQPVTDPAPMPHGVVIAVKASGICRSDWHGWMGHDPDISVPHVPGHELAGTVAAVGSQVKQWQSGDRVTVPFVSGCGHCNQCASGNHQICDHQFQPGFTHWGSFAEYVAIDYADTNLVRLPDSMSFTTAASLGCRFATSFRAVIAQGMVTAGQQVAVYGCGGVGLSAIMIASAVGAHVIAVDVSADALQLAQTMGAHACLNATDHVDIAEEVRQTSHGGVHVSLDALGSPQTCFQSVHSLRKRGKHIQVGLITENTGNTAVPMAQVIANELEIIGSHGMQAYRYDDMLSMITSGQLQPQKLIRQSVTLEQAAGVLVAMGDRPQPGITVIDTF